VRCLVSGASGHLGSRLAKRLVDEGHEVAALVRSTSDLRRLTPVLAKVTLIHGDMVDLAGVDTEVMAFRPDVVSISRGSGSAGCSATMRARSP
jgi:nucleoside-diphosphate-sugar epimerase